jgi:putative ABC transport system permease protein
MIFINTMVFAVRERTFEIGVLKTLGFSNGRIIALILGETLLIVIIGASVGLVLAKLGTVLVGPILGLDFSSSVLAKAIAIALLIGIVTGLLPAINAIRTPILKAFRTR